MSASDRELLFGVLAVQLGLATPQQVRAAAGAWATDQSRGLADRLEEDGVIAADRRRMLEDMVTGAVRAHQGDAHQTLKSFGGDRAVLQSFGGPVRVTPGGDVQPAAEAVSADEEDTLDEADDRTAVVAEQPGRYTWRTPGGSVDAEGAGATDDMVELGRGGIGRVLLAYDESIGREIAVKELLPEGTSSGGGTPRDLTDRTSIYVARFLREARVTGQLEHPNIVPVYELGQRSDDTLYYTMRVVRGRTLAEALKESKTLAGRLKYLPHFVDLCQAIAYAHSRGVTHRDIKPENVMLGEFGETVVLDWGLAKVRGKRDLRGGELEREVAVLKGGDAVQTVAGEVIGTPAYMSPEQADGKLEEIDERSDVWSLASVLYEILTGRPPFEGVTVFEVIGKVIKDAVQPVRESCPQAPAELASVAEKGLTREKSGRYVGARELAGDVEAYLVGGRVRAYTYGAWELMRRFASRHKVELGMGLVAVLLLVVLGVAAYFRVVAERNRAREAEGVATGHWAQAQREGARAALAREDYLEARAKLRRSLENRDSSLARLLWWRLSAEPLVWKFKHGALFYELDFSSDGRTIAAASSNHAVFLLDAETRAPRTLRGHRHQVLAVMFLTDGTLASSSWGGDAGFWDMESGKLRLLQQPDIQTKGAALSNDGRTLALLSEDGSILLTDVDRDTMTVSERTVMRGHEDRVTGMDFAPSGDRLASCSHDGSIRLWDLASGKTLRVFRGHAGPVTWVSFSPNGRMLASAGADHTVRVWDALSGDEQHVLRGHDSTVTDACFSPDGQLVVSSGKDRTLRIWHVITGAPLRVLRGHAEEIVAVQFNPMGRTMASCSTDGEVRLWDVDTARNASSRQEYPVGHTGPVEGLAFSPDGRWLASGSNDKTVRLWEVSSGRELTVLHGHEGFIEPVDFSPDGRVLVSGSGDSTIRVWDFNPSDLSAKPRSVLRGNTGWIRDAVFSPTGAWLASASQGGVIRLWSTKFNGEHRDLPGHPPGVRSLSFGPAGGLLASGGYDGTIRVWDTAEGRERRVLQGHEGVVWGLRFGPDGRRLVSGGIDQTVRVWDLSSGLGRILGRHDGRVGSLDVHPDGRRAGTSSGDWTARIWDLETGAYQVLSGHHDEVDCIRFSPDGRFAATSSQDGTVRLWDAGTGRPVWRAPLLMHTPPAVFTHKGWLLLDHASPEAESGASAWRKAVESEAVSVSQSPDGRLLCMSTHTGALEVWELAADRRLQRVQMPDLTRVAALDAGCVALSGGVVRFVARGGAERRLAENVSLVIAAPPGVFAALGGKVIRMDLDGEVKATLLAEPGVTAIAPLGAWVALGYLDGNVELHAAGTGERREGFSFQAMPASPVAGMAAGPMNTAAFGYANGELGIWSLEDGSRLYQDRLHGPVARVMLVGSKLYAVSELGQHRVLDLSVLDRAYCDLVRDVWAQVPVVWEGGKAVKRQPDPGHRCNDRGTVEPRP